MQTIYNANGEPKTLDPVDAKEHIETGRWFKEPPVQAPEVVQEPAQEPAQETVLVQAPEKRAYNKRS